MVIKRTPEVLFNIMINLRVFFMNVMMEWMKNEMIESLTYKKGKIACEIIGNIIRPGSSTNQIEDEYLLTAPVPTVGGIKGVKKNVSTYTSPAKLKTAAGPLARAILDSSAPATVLSLN